jgi:Glycosyltransferase family 87
VTQLRTDSADSEGAEPSGRLVTHAPEEGQRPSGPIERVMSTVIRKLAWSRLSDPKVAVTVSGVGLLLGILVGATAPNTETLPIRLPLSHLLPSLGNDNAVAIAILYTGDILACLGLAGMLWAHSQGWRPDPRRLLLVSVGVVAVVVSLTPVGSSDVASYAAYGRIASLGGNPYTTSPLHWLGPHSAYTQVVGTVWQTQSSVYGPIATLIQSFAAWIGGTDPAITIWILMILNGAVFLGVGYVLLKTSDDPVRATLFWVANPVIIQQLVGGGQLDTFVAALAICAIQVARRYQNVWGDVLVGLLIGLAFAVKVNAGLIGVGLAWPLLRRHEWTRATRMAAVALVTVAVEYSFYGLNALKSTFNGLKWVIMPSPWRLFQMLGEALGVSQTTMTTIINCLWPLAMFVVAWIIYRRISSDQPREVVAPFALTFAWVVVAPWVFAWYTALAWATLALVPRNRMTRWLTLVTVVLALWLSNGGHSALGR